MRTLVRCSTGYNTLLDACAKAGQPEVCEAWLEQMKTKGIETNVISYATVIYAWGYALCYFCSDPLAVAINSLFEGLSLDKSYGRHE